MVYEWNDIQNKAADFGKERAEDIPQYGNGTWPEGSGLWGFIKHFKWNLNFFIIGIPWVLIMIACITWNFYMNIAWFKWWAGGNFWLMGNTIFLIIQILNSIPVIFEIDVVLRRIKPLRFLTLFSSIMYNLGYIISTIEAYLFLYEDDSDKKNYNLFSLVEFCVLIFNLATNISTFVINWCLILKEFSMEFFQLLQRNSMGVEITDVSLGLKDVV